MESELKCRENTVKDKSRALLLANSGKEMIFHHLNISSRKRINIELVKRRLGKRKAWGTSFYTFGNVDTYRVKIYK